METTIFWDVKEFDQRYDAPEDALNITDPPPHNVVEPIGVILGICGALTLTVIGGEVAIQPLGDVTVTSKIPDDVTVIDCVVCELFHR